MESGAVLEGHRIGRNRFCRLVEQINVFFKRRFCCGREIKHMLLNI